MNKSAKTHFLVLFSLGDDVATLQTALSFISAQCRLSEDIPSYQTIIVTDRPRSIKAYFGSWVEIYTVDSIKLKEERQKDVDLKEFKVEIITNLLNSKKGKFLVLGTDNYFLESPLVMFNLLEKEKIILGNTASNVFDGVLGISFKNIAQLKKMHNWSNREDVVIFTNYFNYSANKADKIEQIKAFFNRHYYREMGELFTLISLWTPDKWHLPESELPQELL